MAISVKSSVKAVERALGQLRAQAPKRLAFALKSSVQELENLGAEQIGKNLSYANTNTRRWTMSGAKSTRFVKPAELKASVWINADATNRAKKSRGFLKIHDDGGRRRPATGRRLAVPTRGVPRAAGVVPVAVRPRALYRKIGNQPTTRVWNRKRRSPATVRSRGGSFVVFSYGRFIMARPATTEPASARSYHYTTKAGRAKTKQKTWRWSRKRYLLWSLVPSVRIKAALRWSEILKINTPIVLRKHVRAEIAEAIRRFDAKGEASSINIGAGD